MSRLAPCLVRVKIEHLRPGSVANQMREKMPLVIFLHAVRPLLDELDGGIARRDLNGQGIRQQALREATDVVRISGREQQVLPLRRQQLDDALDVVDEAHVEHAIRLVQNQHLDAGQIRGTLLCEIEEPAGRRDQDVAARPEPGNLRIEADAAEDLQHAQRHILAVIAGALGDLRRELASRGEHQRTRRALARGGLGKPLQNGQHEACRLAGAGLGAGEHIAACEDRGNGLELNGGGSVVTLIGNGTQQFGLEPEFGK